MAQTKVSPELHNRPTHVKLDISDKIIRGFTYVIVSLFSLMCIIPFWMIVASSFASEASIRLSGFTLWPSEFSAYSYELLLKSPDQMIGAYVVTICLAVVGTAIGLFIISMTGYALQRRDFPFRNGIMFYIYFTSLFSAGLVPFYLLVRDVGLLNTRWSLILPFAVSTYNTIIMRNFFQGFPTPSMRQHPLMVAPTSNISYAFCCRFRCHPLQRLRCFTQ